MKNSLITKLIALFLCLLLAVSAVPAAVFAVEIDESKLNYYQVISKQEWELAPGITESEIVMNNGSGNKRQVSHVVEIDIHNPYTKVIPSSYKMADGLENKQYSVQVMSEQAKYAEDHGYGNVVAAMNTTLHWYDTDYYAQHPELIGETLGTLILDGVRYTNSQGPMWGAALCLVVNFDEKDGVTRPASVPKTEMRWISSYVTGWEEQLIPISFYPLVVDGVNQHVINDPTEPAPRSFIGLKEDGTIITVMNEGRQAHYSTGFNCYEMAEFMISLGCVWAANCDGGGSSTFLSQRPGEDLQLHCYPSDGAERPVTNGILIISTAPSSGEFERAEISAEGNYYTPGSTVPLTAKGYDPDGAPADIPSNAVWELSDASYGTLKDGVFVSNGKCGTVTVYLKVDGKVVGSYALSIVKPTARSFMSETVAVPFGSKTKLMVKASYASHDVILQDSDVVFSLSDEGIGSIDGMYFIAAGADAPCTNAVVTAKICGVETTAELSIGKGSQKIYTFENGNDENPLEGWDIAPVQGNGQGEIHVVNRSSGKVKNGDFALAVTCDFTQVTEQGAHIMEISFPDIDCTGATRIGFWIYLPDDGSLARLEFGKGCDRDCVFFCSHDYKLWSLRKGWNYVTAEIGSNTENAIRISATDAYSDDYLSHTEPNLNDKYTFYIDDITLDYSDAVGDRAAPNVSTFPKIENVATGASFQLWGSSGTYNFNLVNFEATVSDASGIDRNSIQVYVDGVAVNHVYRDGKIRAEGIRLADGSHKVSFRLADNVGNLREWTCPVFRIDTGSDASTIHVIPRDPGVELLPIGSVYWLDVVATDLDTIDQVKLAMELNHASSWELEGITMAPGFTATYDIQKEDNIATLVFERNRSNIDAGEAVLASIPVRTWVSQSEKTPAELVKNCELWSQSLVITLETGEITHVQGYDSPVLNAFGMDNIQAQTELCFNGKWISALPDMEAWVDACVAAGVGFHEHTPVALADKASTCTESGYTGRIFCEGCNSVVKWGTTLPMVGHTYGISGNRIVCACGKVSQSTALQNIGGKNYYSVNGKLTAGWITVNDEWYCFDSTTFAGLDGNHYNDQAVSFRFENGRLTDGVWAKTKNGTRYWYGPGYYKDSSSEPSSCKPYEIDGKTYLFDRNGYMKTGIAKFYDSSSSWEGFVYYDCGTDGAATLLTGPYNGYYYKDGIKQKAYRMVQHPTGDLYFISDGHRIAKNTTMYLTSSFVAGYTYQDGTPLKAGYYTFDAEGKVIVKNGVYDGYLYVNDVQQKAYKLVHLNGDYYFVSDGHKVAVNSTLYLADRFVAGMTYPDGTPMTAGYYTFDSAGKLVIRNGVINGYLYINGVQQTAYKMVKYNGDYYFVSDDHKVAVNSTLYLADRFVAGHTYDDGTPMTAGNYTFDAEGKLVRKAIKNGVINGYLYINGVQQTAYKLVKYDGNYYFISDGHKVAANSTIYLADRFVAGHTYDDGTPLTAGNYTFDGEGKMVILNGVVDGYMYINGARVNTYALVKHNGDYYFVSDGRKVAKNITLYLSGKYVAGHTYDDGTSLIAGNYTFDGEGKMVIKNGVYDGYLYVNNTQVKAYRLEYCNDAFYFVSDGHKVAVNSRLWLSAKYVAGKLYPDGTMVEVGYHYFDETGKMVY